MESSTLRELRGLPTARRGRLWRRFGLGVMLLVSALGLAGVFGPSERTVQSTEAGYTLGLAHGSVVRSGEAVPLEVVVTRDGGFDGPVTLVFQREVFDRFDFQNWYPNPDSEVGEGNTVVYEFSPPAGDRLVVSLDARVAPTQWGGRETYALWLEVDGFMTARTDYTVWVVP